MRGCRRALTVRRLDPRRAQPLKANVTGAERLDCAVKRSPGPINNLAVYPVGPNVRPVSSAKKPKSRPSLVIQISNSFLSATRLREYTTVLKLKLTGILPKTAERGVEALGSVIV